MDMKQARHLAEMICWPLGFFAAVSLAPYAASAATYYVDGGCPTSGSGTTLTCGASGPFRTIMEAVKAAAQANGYDPTSAPITINIRGAHGDFSGAYDEYLGLWGVGNTAAPGFCSGTGSTTTCTADSNCPSGQTCNHGAYYDLNCTTSAPCIIQGCPASDCGQDETPLISGLVRRTDWTETTPGSGIWYRQMEAPNDYYMDAAFNLEDAYDPAYLVLGDAQDNTRTFIQYSLAGDHDTAPADGRWSYDSVSHRVYYNPPGTVNPNTDIKVWVPDRRTILVHTGQPFGNPDNSAGTGHLNNATFRRLVLEGARTVVLQLEENNSDPQRAHNLIFDHLTLRYSHNMLALTFGTANVTWTNIVGELAGRGTHVDMSAFGLRMFDIQGGTFNNVTMRHIGSAGTNGGCANAGLDRPYLDAPWGSAAGNYECSNGNGFESKQSSNVMVTNYSASDLMFAGFHFDETTNGTLSGCQIARTAIAIQANEYTPSATANVLDNITIADCAIDDAGYFGAGVIMLGTIDNALPTGTFLFNVYNNFISHVASPAIVLQVLNSHGTSADQVKIWNNTIWGDRALLGYPCPPSGPCYYNAAGSGIVVAPNVTGGVTNLDIRNNIIKDLDDTDIDIANVPISGVIDNNLYQDTTGQRHCAVNWKGTCYSTVTAFHAAQSAFETNAVSEADPHFVNVSLTPPDLHIQSTSAARDHGATIPQFATDFDGQPRPQGPTWDIGADEYWPTSPNTPPSAPRLLQVEPLPGT